MWRLRSSRAYVTGGAWAVTLHPGDAQRPPSHFFSTTNGSNQQTERPAPAAATAAAAADDTDGDDHKSRRQNRAVCRVCDGGLFQGGKAY